MKIVFLDIDGVLNSELFASESMRQIEEGGTPPKKSIDPFCVGNLNTITERTGAKIVLSSSWRSAYDSCEEANKEFEEFGMTGEIIDRTPRLDYVGVPSSVPRGCEIKAWIDMNTGRIGQHSFLFNDFVILDDDDDMLLEQYENFFRIEPYVGLTPHRAEDVIRFLGEEESERV